jgi:hypothetical protein
VLASLLMDAQNQLTPSLEGYRLSQVFQHSISNAGYGYGSEYIPRTRPPE